MATITSSITSVSSNSVKVSYTITKNELNANLASPTAYPQQKRKETLSTVSISGNQSLSASTSASISGTVTGSYTRTTPTSHTLNPERITTKLSYSYTVYSSAYNESAHHTIPGFTVDGILNYLGQVIYYSGQYCVCIYGGQSGTAADGTVLHALWLCPLYWSYDPSQNNVPATATSNAGSYYKRPSSFTFNNCSSGKQWQVDLGLQSLITNIYDFPYYATHWKAWKNQNSTSGSCPNFSKGDLTASNLNSIYYYVNSTNPYSTGNEVAASMFNNLASAINAG